MSSDPNYTDPDQSSIGARTERVGDITGEPPTNKTVDKDKASKMANLLEGLQFPATKEEIKAHLNMKSLSMGNRINEVLEAVENKLDEERRYDSAYDVEIAAGIVVVARQGEEEPYVRDRALNRANRERVSESIRPDPYEPGKERASGGPASARNVSSNTPKGEQV
jgi:Protein of unknown function (DUF2795)